MPILFAFIVYPANRAEQAAMLMVGCLLLIGLPACLVLQGRRDLLPRFGMRSLLIGMLVLACLFAVARRTNSERSRMSLLIPFGDFALYTAPVTLLVVAAVRSMESARRVGLAMLLTGLVLFQIAMLADLRFKYSGWTSFEHVKQHSRELAGCFAVALTFFIPWERLAAYLVLGSPLASDLSGQESRRDLPQSLGIAESHACGEDRQHEDEQPGGDAD